jgi:peptidoglycan/LPS O-acetylase OafA/YrhL
MQNVKKAIAIFSIVIGLCVSIMWVLLLITGKTTEGPIALGFHLYSEFAMAGVLLVSGIMMFGSRKDAAITNMGGQGMLVYSVLNAGGYYGQKGETGMMALFIALFCFAVGAICLHYQLLKNSNPIL